MNGRSSRNGADGFLWPLRELHPSFSTERQTQPLTVLQTARLVAHTLVQFAASGSIEW